MTNPTFSRKISRRDILKMGFGLAGTAAGAAVLSKAILKPQQVVRASGMPVPLSGGVAIPDAQAETYNLHLVGTDGWIHLSPETTIPQDPTAYHFHPDDAAPPGLTTYIFGFRDVTDLVDGGGIERNQLIHAQKMKAQLTAPVFSIPQETDYRLKLTNLGLQIRPDLIDSHTMHFHGFRNAIPIFDGEPHSSVSVPIVRDLTYFYRPHHPGTYLYHCHFEETEHIHMGMIGCVYVTSSDDTATQKFAYTGAPHTAYDREFVMVLSDIWAYAHWCDSHIQLPEWTDFRPDFWLLNGRVYPDTLEPNGGGNDPVTGDLIPPPGRPDLQYQPYSSLINCNEGDRVLLRFVGLSFLEQTMALTGIPMDVVGRDAALLRSSVTGLGQLPTDLNQLTNTVSVNPGETADAIFVAPPFSGNAAGYDTYLLYNREFSRLSNGGAPGYGGQMTEVRVHPTGAVPAQTGPNT